MVVLKLTKEANIILDFSEQYRYNRKRFKWDSKVRLMRKNNLLLIGLMVLLGLGLGACGAKTKGDDPYANLSPEYVYAKGHTYLQKSSYTNATKAFESLSSQYPFNPYTKQATLESIYAYNEKGDPTLALAAAERFVNLYPSDKNVDYAYYMMGVISFNDGRGFLQQYFPYKMSEHNSDNYQKAYTGFYNLIQDYPNSPYAQDARRRMMYLVNNFAAYQLYIAQFNYKREAYVAAANRAIDILVHYPYAPAHYDALVLLSKCYNQLGLNDLKASIDKVIAKNQVPENPHLVHTPKTKNKA